MGNAWLKRLTKQRWVEPGVERHKHVYKREGYIEHINGSGNKHYMHVMVCTKCKSFVTVCDEMSFTGIVDFVPEEKDILVRLQTSRKSLAIKYSVEIKEK